MERHKRERKRPLKGEDALVLSSKPQQNSRTGSRTGTSQSAKTGVERIKGAKESGINRKKKGTGGCWKT
jgi:hypothetical protein